MISFFRAFNSIYGRVGNSASEEVTLSLIKSKCVPCLLHGLDACPINSTIANSLDFTVRRILFKIFKTSSQSIIRDCQSYFNFLDITVALQWRKHKFLSRFCASENVICRSFRSVAQCELGSINSTPWLVWCNRTSGSLAPVGSFFIYATFFTFLFRLYYLCYRYTVKWRCIYIITSTWHYYNSYLSSKLHPVPWSYI